MPLIFGSHKNFLPFPPFSALLKPFAEFEIASSLSPSDVRSLGFGTWN